MFKKQKIKNVLLTLLLVISMMFLTKQNQIKSTYTSGNEYARIIKQGPKEEKIIALTFDDGPHPIFTPKILDLLDEYQIKATFFVLGKYVELYPEIIKRQIDEGHEIGNHTFSHINVNKSSNKIVIEEFERTQIAISSITQVEPKILRPPYGILNEKIIDFANKNDCAIILWSQTRDPKDWSNPEAKIIADTILSQVKNGDVILLHDYVYFDESHTLEALKVILPELKDRGYKFVTISELMNLSIR